MRIRKKWPPHSPPSPTITRHPHSSTHLLPQKEKIGVSSVIPSGASQGLHNFDRHFSVVNENKRIGWPCYSSNQSLRQHIEKDQPCISPQLIITRDMSDSISSNHKKEESVRRIRSQVKGLRGKRQKDVKEKISTSAANYRSYNNRTIVVALPSPFAPPVERWSESERILPLKKRKVSYQWKSNDDSLRVKKSKMMADTNKMCDNENDNGEDSNLRKRKRSNESMEGSRCNRGNGRGWRCLRMTLVGYSLCQHHLGNLRLRSMIDINSHDNVTTSPSIDNDDTTNNSSNSNQPESSSLFSKPRQQQQPQQQEAPGEEIEEKRRESGRRRGRGRGRRELGGRQGGRCNKHVRD